MDIERDLLLPATPAEVFEHVADLDRYPPWMPLIGAVERVDDTPTWIVLLQAQVGPFTRSKRLRMTRTTFDEPVRAVFERDEVDGRDHAMWRLESSIDPVAEGSRLWMRLHYGGRLWGGPVLERVLESQIVEGSERLRGLLSTSR